VSGGREYRLSVLSSFMQQIPHTNQRILNLCDSANPSFFVRQQNEGWIPDFSFSVSKLVHVTRKCVRLESTATQHQNRQ
jgi:hypothetical protein